MTDQREPWLEQHDRHVMDWVAYWMAKDLDGDPRCPPPELIAEVLALWRSPKPKAKAPKPAALTGTPQHDRSR
jgi:hypothetical protein